MTIKIVHIGMMMMMMTPLTVAAQWKSVVDGKVEIQTNEFSQRGDSLIVNLQVIMKGNNAERNKSLNIIPVITREESMLELPQISIRSKTENKKYKRRLALMSEKQKRHYAAPYRVEVSEIDAGTSISYRYSVRYEAWMEKARLNAKIDLCGCGFSKEVEFYHLADNLSRERIVEPYQVKPWVSYIEPELETVKQRTESYDARFDYSVGSVAIQWKLGSNAAELSNICQALDGVKESKGVSVRGISIVGYASPEGLLEQNRRLSEGRANSLKSYLQKRYNYPEAVYSVRFGGEDWENLVGKIQASDMEYKDEVLAVIKNVAVESGRESELMALHRGVPYRYMLKEMFPSLRRALLRIDYNVKNFNLKEAKEVLYTCPKNLSLNEMYMIAGSYEKGSPEFNDVFETAVRLFPKDETALFNAAVAALSRRDVATGERYLMRVQSKMNTSGYLNARGVVELLKDHYTEAGQYFRQAVAAGSQEAKANLLEMEQKRLSNKEMNKE